MGYLTFDALPGRTAHVSGKEHLFFSGYGYLGLPFVDEFKALVKEGMDKYGWLFPSSRISNTRISLFEECESLLSSITGSEETVLVSTGYIAGRLSTGLFGDSVINLQPSHPAIKRSANANNKGIFAVDSVDILTATITDINTINQQPHLTTLLIDDSHGVGLIGNNGAGASSYITSGAGVDYIFTYSLSKAWGINAGAISCSKPMATKYRANPAYTGATAPSPALIYAFTKGQHIYAMQRERLQENIHYFKTLTAGMHGVKNDEALPIFILPPATDEKALLEKGIIISSFAYPDPTGPKIQRVVLNALHTKQDLERLADSLN